MTRATPLINSFARGAIDPLLHGRVDLERYHTGLAYCENFIPTEHGPAVHRPGTWFVAETRDNGRSRLIPFRFSAAPGQQYMLEFAHHALRIHRLAGTVMGGDQSTWAPIWDAGGTTWDLTPMPPVELSTPYSLDQVEALHYEQSADIMWLVHPRHPVMLLRRFSDTTWDLVIWWLEDGPYLDENTTDITLQPSGTEGTVLLTASSPLFQTGHVGALFRLYHHTGALSYPPWEPRTTYGGGNRVKSAGNAYQAVIPGIADSGASPPIHLEGAVFDSVEGGEGVTWHHLHNGSGTVRITNVNSPTEAVAAVSRRLPGTEPTKHWQEGAWSTARGYPSSVAFHQERLWFAATPAQPTTIWGSASANFEDFAPFGDNWAVLDDGAITKTLSDGQVDRILWLASGQRLHIGTGGAEWTLSAAEGVVIGPDAVLRRSTGRGSAPTRPARINNEIAFIQTTGHRLFVTAYEFAADDYVSAELSLWSRHLLLHGLREAAWAQEPWSCLWARDADGVLVGAVYNQEQEVVAWHHHTLGGAGPWPGHPRVRSLAVVTDGTEDRLWLVVERVIGGQTRRFIEVLAHRHTPINAIDLAPCMHLDAAVTYRGPPALVLTGLDHLNGETVGVVADGVVLPDRKITHGRITIPSPATSIHVGYRRGAALSTLPIEAGAATGSPRPSKGRFSTLYIEVLFSLGGQATVGLPFEKKTQYTFYDLRFDREKLENGHTFPEPWLWTGPVRLDSPHVWEAGSPVLMIRQDEPLPFVLTGIGGKLVIHEG